MYLSSPKRDALTSDIKLQKYRHGLAGINNFCVAIRYERQSSINRVIKSLPSNDLCAVNGNRLVVKLAVEVIDAKLMRNKVVGWHQLVVSSPWSSARYIDEIGTTWRK